MLKSQTEFEAAVFEKSATIIKRRKKRRNMLTMLGVCGVLLTGTLSLHAVLPQDNMAIDTTPPTTGTGNATGVQEALDDVSIGGTTESVIQDSDVGIRPDKTSPYRSENEAEKTTGALPETGVTGGENFNYEASLALWITYDEQTQQLNLVGGTMTDLPSDGWILNRHTSDSYNTGWKIVEQDLQLTSQNRIAVGNLSDGCYSLTNAHANYNAVFYVGLASEE